MASSAQLAALREALDFLPGEISGFTHKEIAEACAARGMPVPDDDGTKYERALSSFNAVPDSDLPRLAAEVLHDGVVDAAKRNQVQDALWALAEHPRIPERTRRAIASAIETVEVFRDVERLLNVLDRLWVLDDPFAVVFSPHRTLRAQIVQHIGRHPEDWSSTDLFTHLGAFDASDRRFALFLESLASSDNVPDEDVQCAFVAACAPHLAAVGLELRETGERGGYPVFTLLSIGVARSRPKNVLFATTSKPDIRFTDAVDNDIEVLNGPDVVLAYDQPIGPCGLRWTDLQEWFKQIQGAGSDHGVKKDLYNRLRRSLPKDNLDVEGPHPQRRFFELYHELFSRSIPHLPALLPEVWLHWDPKTAASRGKEALTHLRMDFLMLLPNGIRIVIEIDGKQHYTRNGRPAPDRYAKMMAADRDLQLSGYRLFRFGTYELEDEQNARETVETFFRRLFQQFGVEL